MSDPLLQAVGDFIGEFGKLAKSEVDQLRVANERLKSLLHATPMVGQMCAKIYSEPNHPDSLRYQAWLDERKRLLDSGAKVSEDS